MAETGQTPEPEEIAAYRAMLKEALRRAGAGVQAPPDSPLQQRLATEVQPVAELQTRVNARAIAYAEIATGQRDFNAHDWRTASAIPRNQEQALAVLEADNLADFRRAREAFEKLNLQQNAAPHAPLAPIGQEQQDAAARQAEHLFPSRILEPVPIPEIQLSTAQPDVLHQRVINAQLRAEQPHVRDQISPLMQERAKEAEAARPESLASKLQKFQQRQAADVALEERMARARLNDTPQFQAHHAVRADNEALAAFNASLGPAELPRSPEPDVQRAGYQPLSAGVDTTHDVTPADVASFADQLANANPNSMDHHAARGPYAPLGVYVPGLARDEQMPEFDFVEALARAHEAGPSARGPYTELGVYHSPHAVEPRQEPDAAHSDFIDKLASVPSGQEMTDARVAREAKAAQRTGVSTTTAGQQGQATRGPTDAGKVGSEAER